MTESERAIKALLFCYAELQDTGDFDGVGELFAHGIFRRGDGVEMTGAELTAHRNRANVSHGGSPGTKHLTTNITIDVDEAAGTATSHAYYTVLLGTADMAPQVIASGRYDDTFDRVDGQWRFRYRDSHLDMRGEAFDSHRREDPAERR